MKRNKNSTIYSTTQKDIDIDEHNSELLKKKKIVSPKSLNFIKLTEKQKNLLEILENNKIILISGPAGTAKTFMSCYYSIKCLMDHKFEKIILTKPIQESGENLGFLPGTIEEKILPFYESFRNNFLKIIDKRTFDARYKDGVFENKPLAYLRGTGFDNSLMILDEAQNADIRSLIMFITRMGENSQIIIAGDISQYDIRNENVGLPFLESLIEGIEGVAVFRFNEEDIMRNKILIEITKRYEKAKEEGRLPKIKVK